MSMCELPSTGKLFGSNMSFYIEGFRGQGGEAVRLKQIAQNRELFEFAEKCSGLAMQTTTLLPNTKGSHSIAVGLFFARCVSHFQAAINLAAGGMTVEALVICRGLVETAFVMCALSENAVTLEELVSHDDAIRVKMANVFLKANSYANVEPFEERLEEFVAGKKGGVEISLYEFAKRGNALALYDGLYRHLSHFAAHPSISAVDAYIVATPIGHRAKFTPLVDYTSRAILSACAGILICCFASDKAGIRTPQTNVSGTQLWNEYEILYAAYDPWK